VQNLGAKLELNSTGSGGYFIEAYAGIDLHSSNNSSFTNYLDRIYRFFSVPMDLPIPRILDNTSHFRYLFYDFRFLRAIATAYRTI